MLTGQRSADGGIRITPATPYVSGQALHWTFEYEGAITGNNDGPIEGFKLAAIQEPITYLLYPARWFPMTGGRRRRLHHFRGADGDISLAGNPRPRLAGRHPSRR